MDHTKTNRTRMVLEAQSFNLLTDREKRNFSKIGERFGYDILNAISEVLEKQTLGDDNKPIMSQKRFKTFRAKFDKYKKIYNQNKKHEMFAKWRYESSLLGYSYSHNLRECFQDRFSSLTDLKEIEYLVDRQNFQVVAEVKDFFTRTSQNGNKYMMLSVSDNTATKTFLFMDNQREARLTNFLDGKYKLAKNKVIFISGSKSNNTFFVDNVSPIETDIYMKLREVKDA